MRFLHQLGVSGQNRFPVNHGLHAVTGNFLDIGNSAVVDFLSIGVFNRKRNRVVMIAVTLFQSLGKAKKATWLVLFRQIILFIPLCVVLPMIGGMGIRGVWLAIALTDAILVAIIAFMVAYEFRKLPATSSVNR